MANKDSFYFDNLTDAADCCVRAAEYLNECFEDYRPEDMERMLHEMHEIEHEGDEKRHEMSSALAKAFVTPIDREDLALLSQNTDDVNDRIEEVLQRLYMDSVRTVPEDAVTFSRMITDCCRKMKEMLSQLKNFKKPEKLHSLIVELNSLEEKCDEFYLFCSKKVVEGSDNLMEVFTWRSIYDMLESCADACEHVGDCADTVIMKNN